MWLRQAPLPQSFPTKRCPCSPKKRLYTTIKPLRDRQVPDQTDYIAALTKYVVRERRERVKKRAKADRYRHISTAQSTKIFVSTCHGEGWGKAPDQDVDTGVLEICCGVVNGHQTIMYEQYSVLRTNSCRDSYQVLAGGTTQVWARLRLLDGSVAIHHVSLLGGFWALSRCLGRAPHTLWRLGRRGNVGASE